MLGRILLFVATIGILHGEICLVASLVSIDAHI